MFAPSSLCKDAGNPLSRKMKNIGGSTKTRDKKRPGWIRTKFDRSLKIKLRNKEKIQKNSFKIELKSINDDNILNIDRKVDFRLSKLYFQKSEIIVSIL